MRNNLSPIDLNTTSMWALEGMGLAYAGSSEEASMAGYKVSEAGRRETCRAS